MAQSFFLYTIRKTWARVHIRSLFWIIIHEMQNDLILKTKYCIVFWASWDSFSNITSNKWNGSCSKLVFQCLQPIYHVLGTGSTKAFYSYNQTKSKHCLKNLKDIIVMIGWNKTILRVVRKTVSRKIAQYFMSNWTTYTKQSLCLQKSHIPKT